MNIWEKHIVPNQVEIFWWLSGSKLKGWRVCQETTQTLRENKTWFSSAFFVKRQEKFILFQQLCSKNADCVACLILLLYFSKNLCTRYTMAQTAFTVSASGCTYSDCCLNEIFDTMRLLNSLKNNKIKKSWQWIGLLVS